MAVFRAFKPEAMNKIAKSMGYTGDMNQFQSFIEQDPMRQQQMQRFTNAAIQMARGGVVSMQAGGTIMPTGSMPLIQRPLGKTPKPKTPKTPNIQQATMERMYNPALPPYVDHYEGNRRVWDYIESELAWYSN